LGLSRALRLNLTEGLVFLDEQFRGLGVDLAHPLGPGRRPGHPVLPIRAARTVHAALGGPTRSRGSCQPQSVVLEPVAVLKPVAPT
jgi:hypothetical protein